MAPSKWVTETTTSCTTSTKTESYAAPTFTKVYGPKAGCKDTAQDKGYHLDSSIDTLYNATQECKGLCVQNSDCSFVYIQRLLSSDGSGSHYECSFNDHELSSTGDLTCGENEKVYGVAIGYDACDRGKEEL